MPRPVSSSFSYITAVSTCRYPAVRASATTSSVSAGSTSNTPSPMVGTSTPRTVFVDGAGMGGGLPGTCSLPGAPLVNRAADLRGSHQLLVAAGAGGQRTLEPELVNAMPNSDGTGSEFPTKVETPTVVGRHAPLNDRLPGHKWGHACRSKGKQQRLRGARAGHPEGMAGRNCGLRHVDVAHHVVTPPACDLGWDGQTVRVQNRPTGDIEGLDLGRRPGGKSQRPERSRQGHSPKTPWGSERLDATTIKGAAASRQREREASMRLRSGTCARRSAPDLPATGAPAPCWPRARPAGPGPPRRRQPHPPARMARPPRRTAGGGW